MNSKKAFLMGGLVFAATTGAFGKDIAYEQTGDPQGTCSSIPASLCNYQGPPVKVTETDTYNDATPKILTMVREYAEGKGFKTTESIPLNGPKSWTPVTCYVIDPSTLSPIGNNCGPNDSVVKVMQAGVYNSDGTITITEHGELLLSKKVNPQFPEGGSMVYTVNVKYMPSQQ